MTTEVIFRKGNDGTVFAVFPYLLASRIDRTITWVDRVGGHAGGHWTVIQQKSVPASPVEYADLLEWLTDVCDYTDLKIINRVNVSRMNKIVGE